ncbi:5-oxoprolinase subunit PxpB [Halobacillus sp. ACCC02827]|uniref:5-oxoprolinase subunit PxpB n=1 Tax=Halobacillus sp. ACCC02827 TaxID=3052090 RepID=UPI00256FD360|nr:5-oxoprolinase subunit PxpB [Halobacillus sp. ACCC02827]WJE16540.1 5-oxoprolinase subunit PxpB [Halobacillus sp. ACCC02827]
MDITFHPVGDQAVLLQLGDTIDEQVNQHVRKISAHFDKHKPDWMIEYIPAFTTITITYDPFYIRKRHAAGVRPYHWICEQLQLILKERTEYKAEHSRTIEIPVCYGGEFGPDLAAVAEHNRLSEEEVIQKHMAGDYLVYMIGFAPGFPYIGGMDPEIATPRRDDPRLAIPEGSVGIAGGQTGVYPIETPGGWQLIGRTPLSLFQPDQDIPSLLQAGDRIRFVPITEEEYQERKRGSQ